MVEVVRIGAHATSLSTSAKGRWVYMGREASVRDGGRKGICLSEMVLEIFGRLHRIVLSRVVGQLVAHAESRAKGCCPGSIFLGPIDRRLTFWNCFSLVVLCVCW